jgi:hypothetical protein
MIQYIIFYHPSELTEFQHINKNIEIVSIVHNGFSYVAFYK